MFMIMGKNILRLLNDGEQYREMLVETVINWESRIMYVLL